MGSDKMIKVNPPWLIPLLKTQFYVNCKKHTKYCNFFCTNCMGQSFCETCKKKDDQHEGHLVFQVFKASYETGIRINDLDGWLDISNIHRFKVNSYSIVYINSRKSPVQERRGNPNTCGCNIIANRPYFCSIECKVKTSSQRYERAGDYKDSQASNKVSSLRTRRINQALPSFRKRPRKHEPIRSPLF